LLLLNNILLSKVAVETKPDVNESNLAYIALLFNVESMEKPRS